LAASIVYIGRERPSLREPGVLGARGREARQYTRRLWWRGFAPLWTSTVVFAALWGWLNEGACGAVHLAHLRTLLGVDLDCTPETGDVHALLAGFVAAGALVHLVAFLVYRRALLGGHARREGLAVVFSGAVGGFLGWLVAVKISDAWPTEDFTEAYVVFATPVILAVILLTTTLFVGLMSRVMDDEDREWSARFMGWVLIATLGWTALSA